MPSLDLQIAADANDAFQADGGTAVTTAEGGTAHAVGTGTESNSPDAHVGWRWVVTGPVSGVTIVSATLRLKKNGTQFNQIGFHVFGEDADSGAVFTSGTLSGRTLTTANTNVEDNINETDGSERNIDVTAIVQEIIDRPGWASGNVIVLLAVGDYFSSFARKTYNNYSNAPTDAARLLIDYLDPAGPTIARVGQRSVRPAPFAPGFGR